MVWVLQVPADSPEQTQTSFSQCLELDFCTKSSGAVNVAGAWVPTPALGWAPALRKHLRAAAEKILTIFPRVADDGVRLWCSAEVVLCLHFDLVGDVDGGVPDHVPRGLHRLVVPAPARVPAPPSHDVPEVGPVRLRCVQGLNGAKQKEKVRGVEKAAAFLCYGAPRGSAQQLVLGSCSSSKPQGGSVLLLPKGSYLLPALQTLGRTPNHTPMPYFPAHAPPAIPSLPAHFGLFLDDTCWSMENSRSCSVSPACIRLLSILPSLYLWSLIFPLSSIVANYFFITILLAGTSNSLSHRCIFGFLFLL